MTIIPALLERGDLFKYGSMIYRVLRIDGGSKVVFSRNGGNERIFGVRSPHKIELVNDCDFGDPKKLAEEMNFVVNNYVSDLVV